MFHLSIEINSIIYNIWSLEVVRAQKIPNMLSIFQFLISTSRKRARILFRTFARGTPHLLSRLPLCMQDSRATSFRESETRNYVSRRSFRIRYRFAAHKQRGPPGEEAGGRAIKKFLAPSKFAFSLCFPASRQL